MSNGKILTTSTHPDTLHIERDTISRNPFVIRRFEEIVIIRLVDKASTKLCNFRFEFIPCKYLVRKSSKCQIEVIRQLTIFEFSRFS